MDVLCVRGRVRELVGRELVERKRTEESKRGRWMEGGGNDKRYEGGRGVRGERGCGRESGSEAHNSKGRRGYI